MVQDKMQVSKGSTVKHIIHNKPDETSYEGVCWCYAA